MKQTLQAAKEALKAMKEDLKKDNILAELVKKAIELKPGLTHLLAFLAGASSVPILFYEHLFLAIILCMVAQIFLARKLYLIARDALIKEDEERRASNE